MSPSRHKVFIADARSMRELPDASIHLVVTSPPYWQLKDYDRPDQIGFHNSYEDYVNNLNLVWKECHRVLHDGCRLCINIGDQFARSAYYGRYKVIPIRTEIIKFCESAGFDYMGAIIWQKVTTCNTTGGATIMGSFPYPRNGVVKIDYEFILLFKKPGTPPNVPAAVKEQAKLTVEEWNQYFAGHWTFPGEKQNGHLAMFPEELPKRLIRMFTFAGETVLDPFLGSGTTARAAGNLGRNSVGYEINEAFLPVIREKIGGKDTDMISQTDIDAIRPERANGNYESDLKNLPYIFRDPVHFDRKTDPRARTFGSKISADSEHAALRTFLRLKRVITPNVIELSDGSIVRLLGIRNRPGKERDAVQWLTQKVKGQGLYLRPDKVKHDEEQRLLAYVYLKNKTFVNLHFLRTKLVQLDETIPFKCQDKFRTIAGKED